MNGMGIAEPLTGAFGWIVQTSVQASVLTGFILLAQVVFRKRLPVRWRYCLWFLLVARLVVPWAPESRVQRFQLRSRRPGGAATVRDARPRRKAPPCR